MFCLRSWIPILFFLTNASPIYLVLFVSATYFLNRPCVYCSLLLAILVLSIFDFHSNWFEPRYDSTSEAPVHESTPGQNAPLDTASIVASAASSTAGAMAGAAVEAVKFRLSSQPQWNNTGTSFLKGVFTKKEWRIPCIDVLVRL